jgi:hypothetical protein
MSAKQQPLNSNRGRREPCRYFNTPRGCREGDRCRFEHTAPQASQPNSLSAIPQASHRTHNHHTNQGPASTSQAAATNAIAPFLTGQGLSKVSQLGAGTDDFFIKTADALSPGQAKHFLEKFLRADFRFKTTSEIYSFLKIVNNATANNSSWVSLH